jgi:DNA-binding beta-propeller fold protein YncE
VRARRHRPLLAAPILAVAGLLAIASSASALGELTQKPGPAGCVSGDPSAEGCQPARALDRAVGIAVSPDGRNVYATGAGSQAVAIFDRDPVTGELHQKPGTAGCVSGEGEGCATGRGLDNASDVVVSPDGRNVYVASEGLDAVAVFNRDGDGGLTQKQGRAGCISESGGQGCETGRGLGEPLALAISADGRSLYIASNHSNGIAVLHRAPDGTLSQAGDPSDCVTQSGTDEAGKACRTGHGLDRVEDIAVSPDGTSVYSTSPQSNTVAILHRLPDGTLSQDLGSAGCVATPPPSPGCAPGVGLKDAFGLALSPDGRSVYVGAGLLDDIAILRRDPGGGLGQSLGADACISGSGAAGCLPGNRIGITALAVSGGGENVYSVGSNGVSSFDRAADGRLTQKPGAAGCFTVAGGEGCAAARSIESAEGIAISPDGRNVYVTSLEPGGIAIFDRAVPPTPPSPDTTAPTVSGFRLAPPRFAAKPKGHGSHFRFTLSEPAGVGIEIQRAGHGKRSLSLAFANRPAGASSIAFGGRVGKRTLAPGAYRATIVATDPAGNRSAAARTRFTVTGTHR